MDRKALKQIRLVVLDVDGVLTNGQVLVGADGQESKAFNVRDGRHRPGPRGGDRGGGDHRTSQRNGLYEVS